MTGRKLHGMTQLPPGKDVGEVLPVFAGIKHEIFVGKPSPVCASCRKPFNAIRKPRKAIRMYPVDAMLPVAFSYNICGACVRLVANGGADHDAVLASVQAFSEASEASQ